MRTKLILASLLLSSCGYLHTPALTPYKMDIRQGNYITPEMREKLKLGMTRSQVRYVLGTPMVSDAFHGNRWDYAYRLEHEGEIVEKQNLTLYFDGDNLVRVDDNGKTVQDMPVVAKQPVEAAQPVAKADPAADVLKRAAAWAAAWSAKDVAGYLEAYTPDYAPQGMSRKAWEKQREARIGKPKVIEVALSDVSASMQDDRHATVTFTQSYRSDAYRDVVQKTLIMVKQGGNWLIADERVGKPAAKAQSAVMGTGEESVQRAVKSWAEVWSARDVAKYLSAYAPGFKPAGMSRAKWEAQRKERIGKANSIAVEVSDLKVKLSDDSHASATFKQDYRSDTHQDSMRKTLKLEKVGGAWLIVAEQAAK
ncbi:MAG TPA: outer membrane protein assembly factor BamE [Gallionella sp.]|nr:outer membrane protein assembly factor BamE [Gallionella sp.]